MVFLTPIGRPWLHFPFVDDDDDSLELPYWIRVTRPFEDGGYSPLASSVVPSSLLLLDDDGGVNLDKQEPAPWATFRMILLREHPENRMKFGLSGLPTVDMRKADDSLKHCWGS